MNKIYINKIIAVANGGNAYLIDESQDDENNLAILLDGDCLEDNMHNDDVVSLPTTPGIYRANIYYEDHSIGDGEYDFIVRIVNYEKIIMGNDCISEPTSRFWQNKIRGLQKCIEQAKDECESRSKQYPAEVGIKWESAKNAYQVILNAMEREFAKIPASCKSSCSQSDWYEGGKCDINGCYFKGLFPEDDERAAVRQNK